MSMANRFLWSGAWMGLFLGLGGCASHNLALVDRSEGTIVTGMLPGSLDITGEMELKVDDENYKGHWIIVKGGEFPLLGRYGKEMLFDSGEQGAVGPLRYGKAYLYSEEEGKAIRCEFKYYEGSEVGTGICLDSGRKVYDLLIGKE